MINFFDFRNFIPFIISKSFYTITTVSAAFIVVRTIDAISSGALSTMGASIITVVEIVNWVQWKWGKILAENHKLRQFLRGDEPYKPPVEIWDPSWIKELQKDWVDVGETVEDTLDCLKSLLIDFILINDFYFYL